MTPREDIDTPGRAGSHFPEFAQNPLHPSGRGGVQRLLALQATATGLHPHGFGACGNYVTQSGFLRAFGRFQLPVDDMEASDTVFTVPTERYGDYPRRTRLMYWGGFHSVGGVIGVRPSDEQIVPPGMLHVVPAACRVWIAPGYAQRTSAY